MKIVVHRMHFCRLCKQCIALLKHWSIAHQEVYDEPIHDRPYPYITIELEYEELVDWIAKGVMK